MKRKIFGLFVIALFICIFSFSGCSTQKFYDMSFEQVVSLLENQNREMIETFFDVGAQQKDMNLSIKANTWDVNLKLGIQSQSKIDYDSKVQDMSFSFDADVKDLWSEIDFITSWTVDYSLIWDDMYLKLSKFSLGWSGAKNLAMISMLVNSFKWQRFKLGMTGVSISRTFDLHDLYSEKLWDIVDNVWTAMINQGSGIYDWVFEEYQWYNAWKYSIDKEKFDEILQMYINMMNEFYSWLFSQYAESLWMSGEEIWFLDFNDVLSGVSYDNLQWYFVIVWKNNVVETIEDAHIDIDGTWILVNYFYWKDGLYLEIKTEKWENMMLIVAKRSWRLYNIYANMSSVFGIKWDIKFNKFSKKWIDVDFDLNLNLEVEPELSGDLWIEDNLSNGVSLYMPLKGNYKVKNIDKFVLQAPDDAIDLMDMLGGFMWNADEGEYLDDWDLVTWIEVPWVDEEKSESVEM